MDILISFTNAYKTPGCPGLGLLNPQTMDFKVVQLHPDVPQTGMLGLAASSKYVFVGLQHTYNESNPFFSDETKIYSSPPALLIFDRKDFSLLRKYVFRLVKDVHSFILAENETILYVVSTGTDELIQIGLDDTNVISEEVFWQPNPGGAREDNYHLNSIFEFEGNMLVSAFGRKTNSEDWASAGNGFIYNITKGTHIVSGLEHPHSILFTQEGMAFCESRKRELHFWDKEKTVSLPGYTRGLCLCGNKIFAGTSAGRRKSKSTGKRITRTDFISAECSISKIDLHSLEVETVLSLKDYAYEIYELLPVDGTLAWPVSQPLNHRLYVEEAWTNQVKVAFQEIRQAIPQGAKIALVDENTWLIDRTVFTEDYLFRFMEQEGTWQGTPQNDDDAITAIKKLKDVEVRYLVFGWPSFWWFDHFRNMHDYLRENATCIVSNERLVLLEMTENKSVAGQSASFTFGEQDIITPISEALN